MKKVKVGFIVYGVHKDGLKDPMGVPFIDDALVAAAKKALLNAGVELVEHRLVVASKEEARACFGAFKKRDDVDALVLFSGTWVWAAHMVGAIRDYAMTGKGLVLWTHPGSQGWRPVGGLVLHGGLKELGIQHRFVYGEADDPAEVAKIVSYCRASQERNLLNQSTIGTFGGRGMGQTCGAADPSQWMKTFGIDIDSRDTTELIRTAEAITAKELIEARRKIQPNFSVPIPKGRVADRSIRIYLAIRKILKQENWDFYTIQSFPGLGDDYTATCFAQSMILNDGIGTSTLCDFNTAMTVKLLTDLGDARKSRSSATAPARLRWPAGWARPHSPNTAFRRKGERAAFP
jgi:L-fucose isomerase-like protein